MMKQLLSLLLIIIIGACSNKKKEAMNATSSSNLAADEIELSDQQIQLGNILTDTIRNGTVDNQILLTATLNFDQTKITAISSRVMGRIEKLYFKNIGDYVSNGTPLFDLYSEELNNAKQEYLLALERKSDLENSIIDFGQLVQSANNKLKLWGMSESQITGLEKSKNASPLTTFYSTASGYITALNAQEGSYIMEGGPIVQLADLSTLWVEAQVYNSQLWQLNRNAIAVVTIPELPGLEMKGKIEFINPEINPNSRINLVRISVPNNHHLKPGMPAYVSVKSPPRSGLTLPVDAVIRNGNGTAVWARVGDNLFKYKMVFTGRESNELVEIIDGLNEGDVIVTSGAYLINSEYIFKKGANPMAGHDMHNM